MGDYTPPHLTQPSLRTSPSPAAQPSAGLFTYFPERGWHLSRDILSRMWFLLTLTVAWAASPVCPPLDRLRSRSDEMISPRQPQATSWKSRWPIKKSLCLDGNFEIAHLFKESQEDRDPCLLSRLTKGSSECQVTSITTATWPETV